MSKSPRRSFVFRCLASAINVFFIFSCLSPVNSYAQTPADLGLPAAGVMLDLSPAHKPLVIKGLTVHPKNPLLFDFIFDAGDSGLKADDAKLKVEAQKLVKYFLASLTVPEQDQWVNLSPYEKDRTIPVSLGETEMGRDMLSQDYVLKQLTASLIYPEKQLGQDFWNKVYAKARELYGTSEVPVNTFNKVWVVADRADVIVRNNTAFVVNAHLKVMLEEDYNALNKNSPKERSSNEDMHSVGSQIVREIVLPELEKEVNGGKHFANLRQIFYSMILSTWYKKSLKEALLNQVYANKAKLGGIDLEDKTIKEQIYQQYLAAYKKGVFNYIKEDMAEGKLEPKKYFSGGVAPNLGIANVLSARSVTAVGDDLGGDLIRGRVLAQRRASDSAMTSEISVLRGPIYADAMLNSKMYRTGVMEHGWQLFLRAVESKGFILEIVLNHQTGKKNNVPSFNLGMDQPIARDRMKAIEEFLVTRLQGQDLFKFNPEDLVAGVIQASNQSDIMMSALRKAKAFMDLRKSRNLAGDIKTVDFAPRGFEGSVFVVSASSPAANVLRLIEGGAEQYGIVKQVVHEGLRLVLFEPEVLAQIEELFLSGDSAMLSAGSSMKLARGDSKTFVLGGNRFEVSVADENVVSATVTVNARGNYLVDASNKYESKNILVRADGEGVSVSNLADDSMEVVDSAMTADYKQEFVPVKVLPDEIVVDALSGHKVPLRVFKSVGYHRNFALSSNAGHFFPSFRMTNSEDITTFLDANPLRLLVYKHFIILSSSNPDTTRIFSVKDENTIVELNEDNLLTLFGVGHEHRLRGSYLDQGRLYVYFNSRIGAKGIELAKLGQRVLTDAQELERPLSKERSVLAKEGLAEALQILFGDNSKKRTISESGQVIYLRLNDIAKAQAVDDFLTKLPYESNGVLPGFDKNKGLYFVFLNSKRAHTLDEFRHAFLKLLDMPLVDNSTVLRNGFVDNVGLFGDSAMTVVERARQKADMLALWKYQWGSAALEALVDDIVVRKDERWINAFLQRMIERDLENMDYLFSRVSRDELGDKAVRFCMTALGNKSSVALVEMAARALGDIKEGVVLRDMDAISRRNAGIPTLSKTVPEIERQRERVARWLDFAMLSSVFEARIAVIDELLSMFRKSEGDLLKDSFLLTTQMQEIFRDKTLKELLRKKGSEINVEGEAVAGAPAGVVGRFRFTSGVTRENLDAVVALLEKMKAAYQLIITLKEQLNAVNQNPSRSYTAEAYVEQGHALVQFTDRKNKRTNMAVMVDQGFRLMSFAVNGQEQFKRTEDLNNLGQGVFIMYPTVNRVQNGAFDLEGVARDLKKLQGLTMAPNSQNVMHGFVRNATQWKDIRIAEDANGISIQAVFETKDYPGLAAEVGENKLVAAFGMKGNELSMDAQVSGQGIADVGFHPFMPYSDGTTLQAKVTGVFPVDDNKIPTGDPLSNIPSELDFNAPRIVNEKLDQPFMVTPDADGRVRAVWADPKRGQKTFVLEGIFAQGPIHFWGGGPEGNPNYRVGAVEAQNVVTNAPNRQGRPGGSVPLKGETRRGAFKMSVVPADKAMIADETEGGVYPVEEEGSPDNRRQDASGVFVDEAADDVVTVDDNDLAMTAAVVESLPKDGKLIAAGDKIALPYGGSIKIQQGTDDVVYKAFLKRDSFVVWRGTVPLKGISERGLFRIMRFNNRVVIFNRSDKDIFISPGEDKAMNVKPEDAVGGIDLNAQRLNMAVSGEEIDIQFDPAMIEQFKRGDFSGITPVIINFTPVPSIRPLLGLKDEGDVKLAKA